MSRKKPELKVVDFKNSIGQVIKPGDEVVIITSGYNHSINTAKGTYLGMKNDGVSCKVAEKHTKYRRKDNGEDVGYYWTSDAAARGELVYPKMDYSHKYGTPEYTQAYAEYQAALGKYYEDVKTIGEKYERYHIPYDRYTTLQLNRIFKIDTTLAEANKL